MARQSLTPVTALGAFGTYAANAADFTFAAADATNKEQFTASSSDLIIAFNSGVSTRTVTITSAADPQGRTGDISAYSLGAGEYAVFGPFNGYVQGWRQSDGKMYIEASHADVKWAIIALPR